jgi:mannose-6-phosphate isomerase-like protein (cupin superfamily)
MAYYSTDFNRQKKNVRTMMPINRRELVSLLPTALFLSAVAPGFSDAESADTPSNPLPSAVYPFASLPVHRSPKVATRPILKGKLATGESVEVHETVLPAGGAPHPPHHHVHTEMWLIREGTVEITIEGKAHRLDGGSLAMVRSNEEHGITNPTDKPATYFVVAIGPGADS